MRRTFDPVLPPEVCWNQVKTDPARVEALTDAFAEALPTARREIAACAATPRGRYIDMSRLLERLDKDRFRADPQLAPVLNALQFLDFQVQPEGCGGYSGGEPV